MPDIKMPPSTPGEMQPKEGKENQGQQQGQGEQSEQGNGDKGGDNAQGKGAGSAGGDRGEDKESTLDDLLKERFVNGGQGADHRWGKAHSLPRDFTVNPADPNVTTRVLTIMMASEY